MRSELAVINFSEVKWSALLQNFKFISVLVNAGSIMRFVDCWMRTRRITEEHGAQGHGSLFKKSNAEKKDKP